LEEEAAGRGRYGLNRKVGEKGGRNKEEGGEK